MKRLAFNGGEISPNMALRCDMDAYARSCTTLTNFDVWTTGGISRRRGMRFFAEAMSESVLLPYKCADDVVYLVELGHDELRVWDVASESPGGSFRGKDASSPWHYSKLNEVSWLQINSLLLICAPDVPVMQLKLGEYGWSFEQFEFKMPPWETEDYQERTVTLERQGDTEDGEYLYEGVFEEDADLPPDEEEVGAKYGERLRVSYYTEKQEAWESAAKLKAGIKIISKLSSSSSFSAGSKLAMEAEATYEYFICTKDWTGKNDLTTGFASPANYQDNFGIAEDLTGFDSVTPIAELTEEMNLKKGDKVVIRGGSWRLFYCIKAFSGSKFVRGLESPGDYPEYFCEGIPIGEALPCRGKWLFYCSGTWYGSYEVRRNYADGALTDDWEFRGESRSTLGNAANSLIEGNEEEEECWLRLFITSVRYMRAGQPGAAWPTDFCGIKLIVYSYQHHMMLKQLADGFLEDVSAVKIPLVAPLTTRDWSWTAFSARCGYPRLACLHESRLFFAATRRQPQSIWASCTNDLNNFGTGDLDTSGLNLEMQTETQAAICWMTEHREDILIGTEEAEWILNARNGGALTAANAHLGKHGHHGSAHERAVLADDSVLYCARGEGRVYEYAYNYELNGYRSADMTVFADHIAESEGGITGGTVITKPRCAAVFTTRSGNLLLMTYNTMHNVAAWHRYVTEGQVESACALTNGNAGDRLFLIVRRGEERCLEVIDEQSDYVDGEQKAEYVSEMVTTAFSVPDANERKQLVSGLQMYVLGEVDADDVMLSLGEEYRKINYTGTLGTGWHELVSPGGWRWGPMVGLRLTGGGATILAVQI